jgi:hypothetical protein
MSLTDTTGGTTTAGGGAGMVVQPENISTPSAIIAGE